MEFDQEKVNRNLGRRKSEQGAVLLMVLLLVVLFTGLGLIAMRHTCSELRLAGAHLDKTQAGMIGEAGLSKLATDMRLHWDHKCNADDNYVTQFRRIFLTVDALDPTATAQLKFSPAMEANGNDDCPTPAGQVPGLNADLGTNLLDTVSLQGTTVATVAIAQRRPVCAPCDPGFSGGDSYAWYSFTALSTATYGAGVTNLSLDDENSPIVQGKATARARMTIGPLFAFDGQCRCGE